MKSRLAQLEKMEPSQVMSVYTGKPNTCCCGCAGKHRYNSKFVKQASTFRGYKVEKREVNDNRISRVLHKLQSNLDHVVVGVNNYSLELGERLYIVYPVSLHKK